MKGCWKLKSRVKLVSSDLKQSYVNQTNVERCMMGPLNRSINLIKPFMRNISQYSLNSEIYIRLEEATGTEDFEERNSILKEGMGGPDDSKKQSAYPFGQILIQTAAAYGTDPFTSDSEDEKRIKRARKEAKATKHEKAKLKMAEVGSVGVVESGAMSPRLATPQHWEKLWAKTIRRSFSKPTCLTTNQNQTVRVMKPA